MLRAPPPLTKLNTFKNKRGLVRISQEWLHGLCKLNEEEVKRTCTHIHQTNSNCYAANHRPFLADKCVTSVDWHASLILSSYILSIFPGFTRPKEYVEVPGAFRQQLGFFILFAWGEKLRINLRFTMGETHRRSIWGPLVVWGLNHIDWKTPKTCRWIFQKVTRPQWNLPWKLQGTKKKLNAYLRGPDQ